MMIPCVQWISFLLVLLRSLSFNSLIIVYIGVNISEFTWSLVKFLYVQISIFNQIWEIWGHYIFNSFTPFLSLLLLGLLLWVYWYASEFLSFFFIFFSFCSSEWITSINLCSIVLILSSALSNLLLCSSNKF